MQKVVTKNNIDDLHPDIKAIVDSVSDKVDKKDTYYFDILISVAIANCIVSVIRLMYACYSRSSDVALRNMRNPGFFTRILIKRRISKCTEDYRQFGSRPERSTFNRDIFNSLRMHAKKMDAQDVENIINLYKNYGAFENKGE